MVHEPKGQNGRAMLITAVSAAAGIALFLLAPILPPVQAFLQAMALVLFSVGLYFSLRYRMTTFSYAIEASDSADGTDFVVRKSQGRRIGITEARLAIAELAYFVPLAHGKIGKDVRAKYPAMQVYNYTVTYRPDGAYLAVFVDGADNAIGVIFEPSAEMVGCLREHVQ